MQLNARTLVLIAAAGSAALLLGAWGFQYIGGLAPCKMCIWQRWPHGIAVLAGGLSVVSLPLAAAVGLLASLAGTGIAIFHSGVERSLWEGPTTCTSTNDLGALSPQQLLDQIMAAPLVRCDEIPWQMFGLSMANWNAVLSAGLVVLWALALLRRAQ
jgi:disulfide bond formation protein DsbB